MKRFFTLSILTAFSIIVLAQPNQQNREKWLKEIRDYKYELIVEQTKMTKEQQDAFFPIYSEMEKEIFQANKDARDLESKIISNQNNTDKDYEEGVEILTSLKSKEGAIEEAYFAKFSDILSKQQLFQLKCAESKFTKSMLDHSRQNRNKTK